MKTSKTIKTLFLHRLIILCLVAAALHTMAFSQTSPEPVSKAEQALVVDSLCVILDKNYVYPETATAMNNLVRQNLKDEKYDAITDPEEFAGKLTEDLRSVSHDKHLGVRYGPRMIAMMKNAQENPGNSELRQLELQEQRENNYGFRELKMLDGNMAYLKFDGFTSTTEYPEAGQVAMAAMQFVSNARVLIIDLRDNGGGSPDMIQLLMTHFFTGETQHLNSFYWRPDDKTVQFWTLPYVPGPKIDKTDIYVLTSSNTFSAAEEFTYNMKNMKRGVIVGETTGGGAHPVDMKILNDHFGMSVPMGKAINPITQTNWEGTGIKPHYEVPRDMALDKAITVALDSLIGKEAGTEGKSRLQWLRDRRVALMEPYKLDEKTIQKYAGKFGPRMITYENGSLWYQREGRPRMKMVPMNADTFVFVDIDYFRLKMLEENGRVVAIQGIYDDGRTDENKKEK